MSSTAWLRAQALGWSLGQRSTLSDAVAAMEFIQADPIRSPARAQDLILRHRVAGYRSGDLERSYAELGIDEDWLYAYGFVAQRLRPLLYPRPGGDGLQGLAAEVAAFVRGRSVTHPREVHAHFGRDPMTNDWGGQSAATTIALQSLHHHGVLRVARRENGVRVYEPAPPLGPPLEPALRIEELVMLVARTLAPVSDARLAATVSRLARSVRGVGGRVVVEELVASGLLASREVDGVRYVWPADLTPVDDPPGAEVRFLAPFDPVVWDRSRFEHLWGWAYRFEAYTPVAKRRLGYYAMPLLWREMVVGWANCSRGPAGIRVEVGFVRARPEGRQFSRALDDEVDRLGGFLGPA